MIRLTQMSDEARAAKAEYQREYRKKHKEQINASMRKWRAKNKDKVNKYNAQYWEKKAVTKKIDPKTDMQSFIDERCILQADVSISNKDLTGAYNNWSNGSISTTKFSLEFRKIAAQLGLSQKRNKHGTVWEGVTIRVQL